MKIKTSELREFMPLAAAVPSKGILPILSYIKFSNGTLTKTDLSTYVIHEISAQGEDMLLNEKILSAFLKDCRGDEFTIIKEGDEIFLVDGKRKTKFATEDMTLFPEVPTRGDEVPIELNQEALTAIYSASKNIGETKLNDFVDFVHITDGMVIGTDRASLFCKKIPELPNLIIDAYCASVITKFTSVNFFQSGNYNFFTTGKTIYGFVQYANIKTPPQLSSFVPTKKPNTFMEFETRDLIGFCESAMAYSPSPIISFTMNGGSLSFVDAEYRVDSVQELDVTGDYKPVGKYLPRKMATFLRSLGFASIQIAPYEKNAEAITVWSEEDKDFVGMITGTN